MRKILFFAFVLVAGVMSVNAKTQVDGIWYILDEENATATVTYGEEDGTYAGRLIIPGSFYTQDENYNYYEFTVTAIGDSAFRNCPNYLIPAPISTSVVMWRITAVYRLSILGVPFRTLSLAN